MGSGASKPANINSHLNHTRQSMFENQTSLGAANRAPLSTRPHTTPAVPTSDHQRLTLARIPSARTMENSSNVFRVFYSNMRLHNRALKSFIQTILETIVEIASQNLFKMLYNYYRWILTLFNRPDFIRRAPTRFL